MCRLGDCFICCDANVLLSYSKWLVFANLLCDLSHLRQAAHLSWMGFLVEPEQGLLPPGAGCRESLLLGKGSAVRIWSWDFQVFLCTWVLPMSGGHEGPECLFALVHMFS